MTTEAQKKANRKYKEKAYDMISFRVKKGKKEVYARLAEKKGVSFASLITDLLDTEAEKNGIT